MKKYLLTLIMLMPSIYALAQHDWVWQMCNRSSNNYPKAYLNFSNGSPDTFNVVRPNGFLVTSASMSDNSGNYLFSSNGQYFCNSQHDTMISSLNFNTGWETDTFYSPNTGLGTNQAVLIIPHPDPDSANLYYVFHESTANVFINRNGNDDYQPFKLRFSVIDMNLDSSKGGIVTGRKDISIITDTLIRGSVTATKHANGRDWWLIKHQYLSDMYYKILISPNGLVVDSQHIGSILVDETPNVNYDVDGQACFSPDGNYYIQVSPINEIEYLQFDRCTGLFSNPVVLSLPGTYYPFGGAISPNGRFIYVTSLLECFQFDTWATNVQSSVQSIAIYDGYFDNFETYFFYPQLAPDGRIYISTFNGNSVLHAINSTDSLGVSCDLTQHSFKIMGYPTSNTSIPNFPNYNLGADTTSLCDSLHVGYSEQQNNITLIGTWPNPASSILNVGYRLPEGKTGYIKIYNTHGNLLHQTPLPNYSTLQHIDVSFLSNGIYLVSIESAGKRKSVRFAVVR